MISQTILFSMLRVLNTPLLWFCKESPVTMAIILLILDFIDCDLRHMMFHSIGTKNIQCTRNFVYQTSDKVVDLLQYTVAIWLLCMFSDMNSNVIYILLGLLVWRVIGVCKFILTRDVTHLVLFFDAIKEIMFLYGFYNGSYFKELVVLVCIGKIGFEYFKNGQHQNYVFIF